MGPEHLAEPDERPALASRPDSSNEQLGAKDGGPADRGWPRRIAPWTEGPTHDIVVRGQLHERLDEIFTARAGLVTGPSGSGKTTLLRAWSAATTCCDVVWVPIDRSHRDTGVLIETLVEAVRSVTGTDASNRDVATEEDVDLIAAMVERSGLRVVIVLDDAQILAGAESVEVVQRLLASNRGRHRVLIVARSAFELGLDELVRRDEILMISATDLQLDAGEAAAIVRSVSGCEIDDRTVASIQDQIGGWTAGAVLAGLVLRVSNRPHLITGTAVGRHRLFDRFFSDEVFGALPSDTQQFLLDTSVLHVLEPGACAELSQRDDAEEILWGLERSNTFTSWIGGDPPQFRYHQLLSSWLRRRLVQLDPARAVDLERRAASWFERHGRTPEAIDHRLAAHDFEMAAQLIIEYGPRALGEGRYEAVRDWIGSLPEPLRTSDISLLVLLAEVEHRLGNNESTTALRAILASRLAQCADGSVPDHLELTVVVQRGTELVVRGELQAAAAQARRALSMIDLSRRSVDGGALRFEDLVLAMDLASAGDQLMYGGDIARSRRVSKWVVDTLPPGDPRATSVRVRCLGQVAVCDVLDGARFAAEESALEAVALCRFHGLDPIDLGYAELALLVAGRQVDRTALHAALDRRISQIDVPAISCLVDLLRSWSYVQSGELARAGRLLASAERTLATVGEPGMLDGLARRVAAMVDVGADEVLLGEREIVVLALLAAGRSRRAVADELHLSLNTIKTYARLAYRALGVTTLEAAVERCGALGIELAAPTGGQVTQSRHQAAARAHGG